MINQLKIGFKIRQLIFAEQGLFFEVQNFLDKEIYCCKPSRLFGDDELLAKFSPEDIRLIGYFMASEEIEGDKLLLRKLKKKRRLPLAAD